MKEKMFLSQVAFHSNLRALVVILLQMLLQSASYLFRFFFVILELRILPSKKNIEGPN